MKYKVVAGVLLGSFVAGAPVAAADLPVIKTSAGNAVPACVTPGRLTAYLRSRNPALDARFGTIAVEYMRHGEALGLRWDYAFYQMIVETASLGFKRANGRQGDVSPRQNNFAGLGATGGGEPGESFPDVSTGVKAHLEHVLLYAGEKVENPVAERTRKVRDWGVLNSWQRGLNRPITFRDLSRKWQSGDGGYANDIENVARKFHEDHCNRPDPQPELLAAVRGKSFAESEAEPKVNGAELARQALERGRAERAGRSSLGAQAVASVTPPPAAPSDSEAKPAVSGTPYTILNAPKPEAEPPASTQQVAAATTPKPGAAHIAPSVPGKCRVWTASYGGQKAVVIRSTDDQMTNYTVLDVNEGAEKREMEAYVAAYAKGGQMVAEFANQTQALEKAFALCPEG